MSTQPRMDKGQNHDEAINTALAQIRIFALQVYDLTGEIQRGKTIPETFNKLIVLTDALYLSALTVKIMMSAR
jgi:hypothetical protein